MPFAVELYFDRKADAAVRAIWQELASAGISDLMATNGSRPHVSLAVYDELDVPQARADLAAFAASSATLDFTLASLGVFPTAEGLIFLAPVVTPDLLELQQAFHERFSRAWGTAWPYYLPGAWVPHCTLAIGLRPEQIPRAVAVCHGLIEPVHGTFELIGLVRFPPIQQLVTVSFVTPS